MNMHACMHAKHYLRMYVCICQHKRQITGTVKWHRASNLDMQRWTKCLNYRA